MLLDPVYTSATDSIHPPYTHHSTYSPDWMTSEETTQDLLLPASTMEASLLPPIIPMNTVFSQSALLSTPDSPFAKQPIPGPRPIMSALSASALSASARHDFMSSKSANDLLPSPPHLQLQHHMSLLETASQSNPLIASGPAHGSIQIIQNSMPSSFPCVGGMVGDVISGAIVSPTDPALAWISFYI